MNATYGTVYRVMKTVVVLWSQSRYEDAPPFAFFCELFVVYNDVRTKFRVTYRMSTHVHLTEKTLQSEFLAFDPGSR